MKRAVAQKKKKKTNLEKRLNFLEISAWITYYNDLSIEMVC